MKLLECAGVSNKRFLSNFVDFPYTLYAGCSNWIPGLRYLDKQILSANPALAFHEISFFMVKGERGIVGRIAVFRDRRPEYSERPARFGWLDFIDEPEVSAALLSAAESWAVTAGAKELHGPLGFTDFDKTGILVSGFEHSASFHSSFNYPYYEGHLSGNCYQLDAEWFEWIVHSPGKMPEALAKSARIARERYGFDVLKDKSTAKIKSLTPAIFDLINSSYENLYGFTKFDTSQIRCFESSLLFFLPKDFVSLVLHPDGTVLGFALALPSLNSAALKSNGNLFPLGLLRFGKSFLIERECADILLVAVRNEFKQQGIFSLMVEELLANLMKQGITRAHAHWQMSGNKRIVNLWKRFDAQRHKRRVCFKKRLEMEA